MRPDQKLFLVKFIHSAIFFVMSLCVMYILYAAVTDQRSPLLVVAVGAVLLEGAILALNRCQCPLTDLAKQYGDAKGSVTDIFLPAWFAPHVFTVCTTLFLIGVVLLIANWIW